MRGVDHDSFGKRWTKDDLSLAEGLLRQGKSYEEISQLIGTRTPGAVHAKAAQLGLTVSVTGTGGFGKRWTKSELSQVEELLANGESSDEVSEILGTRSPGSVAYKAMNLGLISQDELSAWLEKRKKARLRERGFSRGPFRREVLQRDMSSCRVCGKDKNLDVHHIISLHKGGKSEPWNGITLCKHCHRKVESGTLRSIRIQRKYVVEIRKLGFKAETEYCGNCKRMHVRIKDSLLINLEGSS